jgi:glycosyltransferase involved in cell wall biosynthesis
MSGMKRNRDKVVVYAMWGEPISGGGLIRNQVIEQIKAIRLCAPEYRIFLLVGGAFLRQRVKRIICRHCPWLISEARRPRSVTCAADDLNEQLVSSGVTVILRETFFSPRNIYLNAFQLIVFPLFHLLFFRSVIKTTGADIVHCRSYFPAWLAFLVKKLFGMDVAVVFDTRGLVPEEGVACGAFSQTGISYRVWKAVERRLLDNADMIVNVSETFSSHVSALSSNKKVVTIPTSVNTAIFRRMGKPETGKDASEDGFVTMVYLGSLSDNGWHSVENLAKIFNLFKRVIDNGRLLVVTETDPDWLAARLVGEGVDMGQTMIVKSGTNEETAKFIGRASYAVLPFRTANNPATKAVGYTMLASKTGEYLAAGLPVICHGGIGGAGDLIRRNYVGCIFNDETPELFMRDLAVLRSNYEDVRRRCVAVSETFDVNSNARKYVGVYRGLAVKS